MKFTDYASGITVYRGYEYYEDRNVLVLEKTSDTTYSGTVRGTARAFYETEIDIRHPEKSVCDCPFATETKTVCKHMIALYFEAFPHEAEKYENNLVGKLLGKTPQQKRSPYGKVVECIAQMTASEAKLSLCELLFDGPDKQVDKFLRDHSLE